MTLDAAELALVGALAAARTSLSRAELLAIARAAGILDGERALAAIVARGLARGGAELALTSDGIRAFLDVHAALARALDPSPTSAAQQECPSIPWLTTVQTHWIDALSINYAVEPDALARLLPAPLAPEVWRDRAWVQVLISSLRDMRPQGIASLFGVCFYQISYRAAVQYKSVDGQAKRGGYFVRSETNHPVMRAVGNALAEFKFHEFGASEVVMLRDGDRLTVGVDAESAHGDLVGIFDTRPSEAPPAGSLWRSLAELEEPLVECYDALGVDRDGGWLYVLTIDRDPWNARFVTPVELYCEYCESGPLGGVSRLDSVLHFRECGYRWRPLRRERLR
jgi:uncharacterized protein YqjF (DUF2071 family)